MSGNGLAEEKKLVVRARQGKAEKQRKKWRAKRNLEWSFCDSKTGVETNTSGPGEGVGGEGGRSKGSSLGDSRIVHSVSICLLLQLNVFG